MRKRRGFTLVELLVSIGIIVLLLSMLMPGAQMAWERARRAKCQSNLRQMAMAATSRATEEKAQGHAGQYFYATIDDLTESAWQDDGFQWFYPRYLTNPQVAVCPSTKHRIRPDNPATPTNELMTDLGRNAMSMNDSSGGHSYEIRGWIVGERTFPDGTCYKHKNKKTTTPWMVKTLGNVKHPERNFLITDQTDSVSGSVNNWPTNLHNHGDAGINVVFCDGHAEWVQTGRPLLEVYMSSYYNPALNSGWYTENGVRTTGSEADIFNKYGLKWDGSGKRFFWQW